MKLLNAERLRHRNSDTEITKSGERTTGRASQADRGEAPLSCDFRGSAHVAGVARRAQTYPHIAATSQRPRELCENEFRTNIVRKRRRQRRESSQRYRGQRPLQTTR